MNLIQTLLVIYIGCYVLNVIVVLCMLDSDERKHYMVNSLKFGLYGPIGTLIILGAVVQYIVERLK